MSSTKTRVFVGMFLLVVGFQARTIAVTTEDARLERLPKELRAWLEEEVVYIISDRERDAFLDLQSVREREAFISAFWRQRDPDTLTPVNEFKEEHYRRLEYANSALGRDSPVPGWMSDRGKMYILLGEPDEKDSFRSVAGLYPAELWFYLANKEKALPPLLLLFFQEGNAGPYRLFNHVTDRPESLMPAAGPTFDSEQAHQYLLSVSPDLAHATVTLRADRGGYGSDTGTDSHRSSLSLDSMAVLREISISPYRHVDTVYVDAAEDARGLVESEYLFNYVPNAGTANVVRGPNGASFVHYSIEIEPQHLTLAKDGDSYYTTFELAEEVTTLDGHSIFRADKTRYVALTEHELQQVRNRPVAYRSMFPLVEGEFTFRVVLKNRARNEYTIFETPIRITEVDDEHALGGPILLYDIAAIANTVSAEDDYSPYQIGPMKLDPNARRLYAIGEPLAVYVPLENASAEDRISLRIESNDPTVPVGVTEKETPATRTRRLGDYEGARVLESLSTEGLSGGRYRLIVGLTKGKGEDSEDQSVDFSITPLTRVLRPWAVSDRTGGTGDGSVPLSLAKQYVALGKMAEAREMFARTLAENPSLTSARVFLAHAVLDDDKPEDAIALLEPALEANKDHYELLVTLGDAYRGVSKYERAVQLFEAAIGLREPNTALLNALAECHTKLGNLDKARDWLEQSLALDPTQDKVELLLERMRASTRR